MLKEPCFLDLLPIKKKSVPNNRFTPSFANRTKVISVPNGSASTPVENIDIFLCFSKITI